MRDETFLNFFPNGISCLVRDDIYENRIAAPNPEKLGYECSGALNGCDKDGSNFGISKENMDPIWDLRDSNIAAHELGFDENTSCTRNALEGNRYYRFDDPNPQAHNLRCATGEEPGAKYNSHFTGRGDNGDIDFSKYNYRTSGGIPEGVINRTDTAELNRSEKSKLFNDPNKLTDRLCRNSNKISQMEDGPKKDAAIQKWREQASLTDDRISRGMDYLQGRIADHEKRMSEFPEGSLEYNRALDNRNWCQTYSNELARSHNKLQENQNALNSNNGQLSGTKPTEPQPAQINSEAVAGQKAPQTPPNHENTEQQVAGTTPDKKQDIDIINKADSAINPSKDLTDDVNKNTSNAVNIGIT